MDKHRLIAISKHYKRDSSALDTLLDHDGERSAATVLNSLTVTQQKKFVCAFFELLQTEAQTAEQQEQWITALHLLKLKLATLAMKMYERKYKEDFILHKYLAVLKDAINGNNINEYRNKLADVNRQTFRVSNGSPEFHAVLTASYAGIDRVYALNVLLLCVSSAFEARKDDTTLVTNILAEAIESLNEPSYGTKQ